MRDAMLKPAAVEYAIRSLDQALKRAGDVEWISKLPETGRSEVMSAFGSRPTLHQRESLVDLMSSTDDPLLLGVMRKELDSL